MKTKRFKRAFTLIELVIAISVMGVLTGFSTASFNGYREMSVREQKKLEIQKVKNAVDNYYSAYNKYPTNPEGLQPTPDVEEGGAIKRGYSPVDIQILVNNRYLQEKPLLDEGEFFAVDFNGIITIEKSLTDNLIAAKGAVIVPKSADIDIDFYSSVSGGAKSVTITEVDSTYKKTIGATKTFSLAGTGDKSDVSRIPPNSKIAISQTPGQKYFRAVTNTGTESRASVQYAIGSESDTSTPFWVTGNASEDKEGVKTKVDVIAKVTDNKISIDFSGKEVRTGGSKVLRYEIQRLYYNGSPEKDIPTPHQPKPTSKNVFEDSEVKGGTAYSYKIYAVTGNGKKTSNFLYATTDGTIKLVDNPSHIENITKDDFNTAYNKEVAVRVGDYEGVRSVTLYTAVMTNGVVSKDGFVPYEMNKTKDGSSSVFDKELNLKIDTDVYTVPIEVKDDYMLYYIKVTDSRGYEYYNYVHNTLVKGEKETDADFEKRRTEKSTDKEPIKDGTKGYTLMRGLVEIHNDSFADDSKIDNANSNYHLFDGKVTLP